MADDECVLQTSLRVDHVRRDGDRSRQPLAGGIAGEIRRTRQVDRGRICVFAERSA